MPPIRTIPPAKVVKTERTHEENQERAYIAASRRSDRSLEARVESARRASEIHKRRTGRSLRVTEQDVINEEMYEEEDDDLPLQYRRLTAHLQTSSADFNRRLAAYLTNQVAMRSAMEQMVNNSYSQSYPNAPQFANNMFPSPISNQPISGSPTMSYRHAPYPNPHRPNFQQTHGRSYSNAATLMNGQQSPGTPGAPNNSLDQGRMSTPASLPTPSQNHIETTNTPPDPEYQRQTQSATNPNFPPLWQDMGPFTTALPPEAQQMVAPGLDPNDPFTANLMAGSDLYNSNPYYPWGAAPVQYDKNDPAMMSNPFYATPYTGMSATLAPSALGGASGETFSSKTPSTTPKNAKSSKAAPATTSPPTETLSAPSTGLDFNLSQESKILGGYPEAIPSGRTEEYSTNHDSGPGSGYATPRDGFWDAFVHESSGEWDADGTAVA